ncbi:MAG: hypothetical protein ABII26_01340 [Pseudomonadota bacterium]
MEKRMTKEKKGFLGGSILSRPCIHLEKGRTGIPKICIRNDECWHCAFDQWIREIEERQEMPFAKAA